MMSMAKIHAHYPMLRRFVDLLKADPRTKENEITLDWWIEQVHTSFASAPIPDLVLGTGGYLTSVGSLMGTVTVKFGKLNSLDQVNGMSIKFETEKVGALTSSKEARAFARRLTKTAKWIDGHVAALSHCATQCGFEIVLERT